MKKKLVIFDCDGVLIDSEYLASGIFSEALNSYGYSISIEESIKRFTGINEHDARKMILQECAIDIPENYWELQQARLQKAYETELTPLVQPVLEMLEVLKLPRCVASNSSRSHVINCLKVSKQINFFSNEAIFTSQQVARPKPASDLFLFAANQMGFHPEDCIVIEDSLAGTQAGIAAGMNVLVFHGGSHACYDWYKNNFANYDRPIFSSCHQLLEGLSELLRP